MSENNHIAFVDEKSIHDQLLSALAVIVMIAIVVTGVYWQSLPLPTVQDEAEHSEQ